MFIMLHVRRMVCLEANIVRDREINLMEMVERCR